MKVIKIVIACLFIFILSSCSNPHKVKTFIANSFGGNAEVIEIPGVPDKYLVIHEGSLYIVDINRAGPFPTVASVDLNGKMLFTNMVKVPGYTIIPNSEAPKKE